ncbi:MAG: hypothetical protein R3B92_02460 [Patescibacteria group bacterium]
MPNSKFAKTLNYFLVFGIGGGLQIVIQHYVLLVVLLPIVILKDILPESFIAILDVALIPLKILIGILLLIPFTKLIRILVLKYGNLKYSYAVGFYVTCLLLSFPLWQLYCIFSIHFIDSCKVPQYFISTVLHSLVVPLSIIYYRYDK